MAWIVMAVPSSAPSASALGPGPGHGAVRRWRATGPVWRAVAAAAPLVATILLLLVLAAVRRDDPGAAVAIVVVLGTVAAVGAAVAHRRPEHPCGWLLSAIALFLAASATATDWVQTSLAGGDLPGTVAVAWASTWLAVPAIPAGILLLLTFPSGHLPAGRAWRVVAVAAIVAATAQAVALALAPGPVPIAPELHNPLGLDRVGAVLDVLSDTTGSVTVLALLAAVGRLLVRYRRSRGREREQLRTVAMSLPIVLGGGLFAGLADGVLDEASFYVAVSALLTLPVSIGWAVVRHRLFDIDVLLNRALVWTSLTGLLLAMYVFLAAGIGTLLGRPQAGLGISAVATGVVAVTLAPLRTWLQARVDQAMYGQRSDPYAALVAVGRRLEDAVSPEDVLPSTAEAIGRSLMLAGVEISAFTEGSFEVAAAWREGGPAAPRVELDLVHSRELVGRLSVAPRAGEALSRRDLALLDDVRRPVAVAVQAVQVGRQLASSRRSLLVTSERERRRLRDDLHDGLGPQLAGIVLGLRAARNILDDDVEGASSLLAEVQAQLRTTMTQVRSLVEGLAPSVDQLGLAPAIEQDARRLTEAAGITLELDLAALPPDLPAAVELATHRIVLEALANTVRHAGATTCRIRVALEGDTVELDVVDDGRGLPDPLVPGIGMSSMRRRALELGGTFATRPAAPAGTAVHVRVPVP